MIRTGRVMTGSGTGSEPIIARAAAGTAHLSIPDSARAGLYANRYRVIAGIRGIMFGDIIKNTRTGIGKKRMNAKTGDGDGQRIATLTVIL